MASTSGKLARILAAGARSARWAQARPDARQINAARQMHAARQHTGNEIAQALGVSRATVYRALAKACGTAQAPASS